MSLHKLALIALFLLIGLGPAGAQPQSQPKDSALAWPAITKEMRPWAYWWWMGSAVDPQNLAREMQRYHDGGLGGMHIIPIYGAKGFESKFIEYLSPKWMEMMGCAVSEARKRGMDVDMTLGSGWCFGGPQTTDDEANARPVVKTIELEAGKALDAKFDKASTQALVAFAKDGRSIELTDKIGADGGVAWTAEGGPWTVYAVSQRPSGQKVKRPAPGGEGHMLNPFYGKAVNHFLERFTQAFDAYKGPRPRAIYHDSYEYNCSWSPDLFKEFEKRRGYRLQDHLPELFGREATENSGRVKSDYRETISDMMVENFNPPWIDWAHQRGMLARDEAHGSPGNLLDLYGQSDSPETEMFNADRDIFVSKAASSAAHVMGRKLTSSETGTWLAEHFHETLGQVKELVDELFVSGVNHIIYHGCCYSPDEAGWPGWLFYASTEMNPRNSFWRDVPALNQYIARCQSILQPGRPDNDVLLYWPIHDMWMDPAGMVQNMAVHRGARWIKGCPFGDAAELLWKKGYTFDYISDRQVAASRAKDGGIEAPGGGLYKTVVVPQCKTIPPATMRALLDLAIRGATVIFEKEIPQDVPGLGNLEARREELKTLLAGVELKYDGSSVRVAELGKGRLLVGDVVEALKLTAAAPEAMAQTPGVMFIRRAWDGGRHYFIINRGDKPLENFVMLAGKDRLRAVEIMDPLTGKTGLASLAFNVNGGTGAYLQIPVGGSLILRTFEKDAPKGEPWVYAKPSGAPVELTGRWDVKFIEGGPALPKGFTTTTLASWTAAADPEAQRFAGAARYTLTFDRPAAGDRWLLDLGKVCQSARVKVNGKDLGTAFTAPFQVTVDNLKERGNRLEVEVTNVSANRLRDLDIRKVPWKTFYDINIVNIDYRPLDASKWPLVDSGLLGPVTLTPLAQFTPGKE